MEGYELTFKFTIRVVADESEDQWKQEVMIQDVAGWADKGNRTVAEECRFLVEIAIREKGSYINASQIVENGLINCYVKIGGVSHNLSNALLHRSKGNLIEFFTETFPENRKLDLCINFTYPQ